MNRQKAVLEGYGREHRAKTLGDNRADAEVQVREDGPRPGGAAGVVRRGHEDLRAVHPLVVEHEAFRAAVGVEAMVVQQVVAELAIGPAPALEPRGQDLVGVDVPAGDGRGHRGERLEFFHLR